MSDRDDIIDALRYASFQLDQKRVTFIYAALYAAIIVFVILFFTSCAPKEGETPCGKPNQYQCVNLCDGLFVKRQTNWNRYYANELDCNTERNLVYQEYE